MILKPTQAQMGMGRVELERHRGALDVMGIPLVDLVSYVAAHGLPGDVMVVAGCFQDQAFLRLEWEDS